MGDGDWDLGSDLTLRKRAPDRGQAGSQATGRKGCREGGLQIQGWPACSTVGASEFHRAYGTGGKAYQVEFPTHKHLAKQLPLLPRVEGSTHT